MILNEIERAVICGKQKYRTNADFIDAIEAAVIAKLAQGVDLPEPVQHITSDVVAIGYYSLEQLTTAIAAARVAENERCANWLDKRGASAGGQDLDPYRLAIGIRALKGGAA